MDFDCIGFIGLGAMGYPMARQLVLKLPNAIINIYDVDQSTLTRFRNETSPKDRERIHVCESAKQVAERSNTILSMVPEGSHVRDVYLSDSGVLSANTNNKTLIDCSTIDPATTRHIAETVRAQCPNTNFYDAPVSGGVVGAEAGTLTIMLGCTDHDPKLADLTTLMKHMGRSVHACGGPGAGVTTKLCNNYLSGLIAIAASEAMNLGVRSGLDPRRLAEVFQTSTAQNAIMDRFCPVPGIDPNALSTHGYKGGFRVQLMCKDFGLAVQAAQDVGAQLALGQAGLDVYKGASQDEKCRDRDSRVVYRYLGGIENWEEWLAKNKSSDNDGTS